MILPSDCGSGDKGPVPGIILLTDTLSVRQVCQVDPNVSFVSRPARFPSGGYVTQSVIDIWDRIRADDHRAWKLLVHKYDALVNTVAIRCGLTGADVEDCAQHTWVALYRCRKSIKDPKALPKWLMQTAQRRAVRMLKGSHRTTVADDGISMDPRPLPDEELLQIERRQELEEAMSYLDDRCQRLIEALFFSPQGRSYADIAQKLGIPANSLGPIRSRCLARMRQILEDLGYLP